MTNLIKRQRKHLKLTQLQLAKLVGVSHVTISDWERGDTAPKGQSLMRLAKALQVEVDTLLNELFSGEHSEAPVGGDPCLSRCATIIRALRLKAALSQPELAKIIGFSDVSVYKWEAAKVQPKMDSLIALSRFFGINMLDAIMDEDWDGDKSGHVTAAYQKGYRDGQVAVKASLKTLLK